MPGQETACDPPVRWGKNTCGRCGAVLVFRFGGSHARPVWELFRPAEAGGMPIRLVEKRCHRCQQSFAALTGPEVRDLFWPGGMVE